MDKKTPTDLYNGIFPTRLREVMGTQNVTQAMLAAEIGVSRQSVAKYTSGQAQPNVEALQTIVKYLKVPSDYLIGISKSDSLDPDMSNARIYTGLSEKAIDAIKSLRDNDSSKLPAYIPPHIEILNTLFTEDFIKDLIESLQTYLLTNTDGECTYKVNGHTEQIEITGVFAEWQLDKRIPNLIDKIKCKLFEDTSCSYSEEGTP